MELEILADFCILVLKVFLGSFCSLWEIFLVDFGSPWDWEIFLVDFYILVSELFLVDFCILVWELLVMDFRGPRKILLVDFYILV